MNNLRREARGELRAVEHVAQRREQQLINETQSALLRVCAEVSEKRHADEYKVERQRSELVAQE